MSLLLPESGKYLSRYQAVDPRPATDCVGATRSVQLLVVLAWVVSAILNGASIVVWAQPVEPVLFAPETLSTGNVYRGTFTPDGRTFFFFKKVTEGEEDFRIFRSHLVEGYWTLPEQVQLGGDFSDLYPAISPDGQHMVFSSYRPAPGDTSAHASAYLWYVERSGDGWGEPVFMQEASALGHYHAQPIFDAQGHLSFARLTWNYRDKAEYVTRWESGRYLAADTLAAWQYWREHLPEYLHLYETTPGYDGSYILLVVGERDAELGRPGPPDLWIAQKAGDRWMEPRPLGDGVNTASPELFAFYSPDGETLYFVRDFGQFYQLPLSQIIRTE